MAIFNSSALSLSDINFLNIPITELPYPSLSLPIESEIKADNTSNIYAPIDTITAPNMAGDDMFHAMNSLMNTYFPLNNTTIPSVPTLPLPSIPQNNSISLTTPYASNVANNVPSAINDEILLTTPFVDNMAYVTGTPYTPPPASPINNQEITNPIAITVDDAKNVDTIDAVEFNRKAIEAKTGEFGPSEKLSEFYGLKTLSATEFQKQIDEAVAKGEKEIVLNQIVSINAGEIINGKGITVVASKELGDGGQGETQLPLFEVNSGSLTNIRLIGENGGGAADGIHTFGKEVTLDGVHVDNIGEDAVTAKDVDTLNIINSSFKGASDKVIQVNTSAEININNVTSSGNESNSKFLRINGGQTYPGGKVTISNSNLDNPKGIVGIDESGQGYTIIEGDGNNINGNDWLKIY